MTSAAFPTVIAAVLATAETSLADDVRVIRGQDLSQDPGDVVMVGVQDYDATTRGAHPPIWDTPGSFEQQFQTFGGNRSEAGTVNGVVASRNGDSDIDAACSAVFDLIADLEAAVREDPSLGVTTLGYLVCEMRAGDVRESLNSDGALAAISFTIQYKARI